MTSHLSSALVELQPHCSVAERPPVNGWSVDEWTLSADARIALGEAYKIVLRPTAIDAEVVASLALDGVDLSVLLIDEEGASPTITRADMLELAAAMTLASVEALDVECMHMPNVPKGDRDTSAPGIDIAGAKLKADGPPDVLHDDEYVVLCSVKHTVCDASDLRSKLVDSLSETKLTPPYVASQLRLLDGLLCQRGAAGGRVFLALRPSANQTCLRLIGVAAADSDMATDLSAQLANLPAVVGCRVFRQLLVPAISTLHELIDES